jgi:uncharacterized membrane protein
VSDLPPPSSPPDPPGGSPPGGQPPPPPPPPPPAGGGTNEYSVGAAFNWGWQKFQQNIGVILIGMLIYVAAVVLLTLIWSVFVGAIFGFSGLMGRADPGAGMAAGFFGMFAGMAITGLVGFIGAFIIQAAVTRAALAITYGERVELGLLFATDGLAQVALGAVILGIATSIGYLFCFIPGLIVVFFGQFFVFFALDKRLSAMDAISASFSFVNQHLATLIGFYLASLLAIMLGSLLCGIGALVAFPIVVLAQAYTYRRLQGEPVAA